MKKQVGLCRGFASAFLLRKLVILDKMKIAVWKTENSNGN